MIICLLVTVVVADIWTTANAANGKCDHFNYGIHFFGNSEMCFRIGLIILKYKKNEIIGLVGLSSSDEQLIAGISTGQTSLYLIRCRSCFWTSSSRMLFHELVAIPERKSQVYNRRYRWIVVHVHCCSVRQDRKWYFASAGVERWRYSQKKSKLGKSIMDYRPKFIDTHHSPQYVKFIFASETFKQLVRLKSNFTNLKILLSIGGWTLSNQLVTASSTETSRQTFVQSAVKNLRKWELDGLDVDWEYPDVALKEQYSSFLLVLREFSVLRCAHHDLWFVQDLREAFEKEARLARRTRLALAAAVHFTSDGGYDGRILNQLCLIRAYRY